MSSGRNSSISSPRSRTPKRARQDPPEGASRARASNNSNNKKPSTASDVTYKNSDASSRTLFENIHNQLQPFSKEVLAKMIALKWKARKREEMAQNPTKIPRSANIEFKLVFSREAREDPRVEDLIS